MSAWTVRRRGTDSSGRAIFASDYMWAVWLLVLAHPLIKPFAHKITITQGAWMTLAGGGANASAGYHDGGGCFDVRVWNLTDAEVRTLIRVLRLFGIAAWLRNLKHGGFKDAHIHLVLGTDHDLDDGAAWQWREYVAGRNGLASAGPDYHWRPRPLVTTPPEDDMPFTAQQIAEIVKAAVREELKAAGLLDLARLERDRAIIDRRKHGETQDLVKDEG